MSKRYRLRLTIEDLEGASDGFVVTREITFPAGTITDAERGFRTAMHILAELERLGLL